MLLAVYNRLFVSLVYIGYEKSPLVALGMNPLLSHRGSSLSL